MFLEQYAAQVSLAAEMLMPSATLLESKVKPFTPLIPSHNPVNHPSHYTQGGVECIDAIEAALGAEGFKAYCRGACLKYLWRTEYKNGVEDLKKCEWYLKKLIEKSE
jgi:hypothetical protein